MRKNLTPEIKEHDIRILIEAANNYPFNGHASSSLHQKLAARLKRYIDYINSTLRKIFLRMYKHEVLRHTLMRLKVKTKSLSKRIWL